ncbi:hypothetical protein N7532_002812, partial [Penicillium argentinense]
PLTHHILHLLPPPPSTHKCPALPPPPDYDPNRQGQYPPQWNGQGQSDDQHPAQYPVCLRASGIASLSPAMQTGYLSLDQYPPASYPPAPEQDRAYYPPPPQYPPANMAAIHPHAHGQDPYRLPPPPGAYRPDPYGPPPGQPQVVHYQAAAPRQRTAIACRYCRRRKIRCSGFDTSQDGRCTNCIRFNQECMFTPVSSQAQAFVPAQVAYPHLRNQQGGRASSAGLTLYGAHGQPLPPQQQAESTLPPPQGIDTSDAGALAQDSTTLIRQTSHPSPPVPDTRHTPLPPPYYPPPPQDRRTSPQQAGYGYDARHSSSPHSSPYPPMTQGGPTPPPSSTPGGSARGGLNVRDMLNPGNGNDSHGRSSTDSDMLNALNRRGLNQ